jgi:hypothetical protein
MIMTNQNHAAKPESSFDTTVILPVSAMWRYGPLMLHSLGRVVIETFLFDRMIESLVKQRSAWCTKWDIIWQRHFSRTQAPGGSLMGVGGLLGAAVCFIFR